MSDKWDEMSGRVSRAILADEPGAVLATGLEFFAEFGRTLELLGEDTNRLATAAEKLVEIAEKTAQPEIRGEAEVPAK